MGSVCVPWEVSPLSLGFHMLSSHQGNPMCLITLVWRALTTFLFDLVGKAMPLSASSSAASASLLLETSGLGCKLESL